MAWNKPSETKVEVKDGGGQRNVYLKGILAGVIVIALGAGAFFLFSSGEADPRPLQKERTPKTIKEIAPATNAVSSVTNSVKKEYKDMTNAEKLQYFRNLYGDNPPMGVKTMMYFLEHPSTQGFHPARSRTDIFKHFSEKRIAGLLLAEPGRLMIQMPTFDDRFDKDLESTILDKIEILDTDSEQDRQLKQAVIDTKKELFAHLKETGEMPSTVLAAEAKKLYELGRYKHELQRQITAARKNADYSDDDVRDFVMAANSMLEQKGLKPFSMPSLVLRQTQLTRAKGRAESGVAPREKLKNYPKAKKEKTK